MRANDNNKPAPERLGIKPYLHDPQFPLAVVRAEHTGTTRLHLHNFAELVVVYSGDGIHHTEVEDYTVTAGDVFVAPVDTAHGFADVHKLGIANVVYDLDVLGVKLYDLGEISGYHSLFVLEPRLRSQDRFRARLKLAPHELVLVMALVDELQDELDGRAPGYRLKSVSLLTNLLCWLSRRYGEAPPPQVEHLALLGDVLSYIESNLTSRLTIQQLADRAHMSRSAFYRHFTAGVGAPPLEHINKVRIARAARLLRETPMSVGETAAAVGFANFSYFARKFREVMGLTPREHRSGARRGPDRATTRRS